MSIDKIMKALQEDKHGVTLLSDDDSPCVVSEWISTGCLSLDAIMGGGLPAGRIVEIYGDTSTGKTLIAEQIAAIMQALDGIVLYIDTEAAISIPMMEAVGVDPARLMYYSPDTVEQVFNIMQDAIEVKNREAPDTPMLIVWDSVAATTTMAEQTAGMDKIVVADAARTISKGLRLLARDVAKSKTCCLLLNQVRTKIGVMFGDNETTYGGKGIEFYCSIRIRLKNTGKLTHDKKVIGINTRATVVKNKVAVPFKEATLPIFFGHGISDALAAYEWLSDNDMLKFSGGWGSISINGEEVKVQKNGNWQQVFDDNYDAISNMILGSIE